MADIDSLQIKINAEATKANNAIDNLIIKLDKLTTSLIKVDGSKLSGLANGVQRLGNAMQSMSNVKTGDFKKIASGIERLSSIQAGNMEVVGNALKPLAEGIKVLNNSNFDNKNLQNLINGLTRLSNANVANLSNIDFTKIGNSIKQFATSLSDAPKIQQSVISMTNAVANLAKSGTNIPVVSTSLGQLGTSIRKFISDMSLAPSVSENVISFTQSIAALSNAGDKTAKTASNLGALAIELKKFMQTMSSAPSVNSYIIQMTNALANLAKTGASSGRAASSMSTSFTSLSRTSKNTIDVLNKVQSSFKGLLKSILPILGIRQLFNWGKEAIKLSSDLTEVQNVVDVTFGDMAYKIEDFAQTSIEQFGMSELALKRYASRFQSMGSAMGIDKSLISNANAFLNDQTNGYIGLSDSMSDVSINLTKLTADMASFYNLDQDAVAEDLESIFTGQTRPLRTYGLDLTEATLKEWAMKNGLDANIDSMTQAEKTMLRYQYVLANTGAAQGDFARTADTWANQVRILKQNFEQLASVIGDILINALKPLVKALNSAMAYVISFAKTISNSLGKIFGWTYEESGGGIATDFEDAAESADDIAGSTGKAADNVKKMQAGLRAFDELKTIDMPDDTSASGSAGSGSTGGIGSGASAAGGQWKKTDGLLGYESELDTLYKLGDYISQTLSRTMESIDWNSIYEKARGFGTGLADFLNGLISPRLFGNVGRTIASSLNTAIYTTLSFGETFDWENLGDSIAEGINDFFRTFDFKALAKDINVWVHGLKETLKTVIKEIDWSQVGQGIKDFFSEIEIDTVALIIGIVALKKILGLHLASSALSWLGTEISKKIAQSIAAKLGIELAENAGIGTALKTGLASKISSIGVIKIVPVIAIAAIVWKIGFDVGKSLGKALFPEDAEWYDSFTFFEDGGFFDTIYGDVESFEDLLYVTFVEPLDAIKLALEDVGITAEDIKSSAAGLFGDLVPIFAEFKDSFSDGSWKEALSLWKGDIETNLIALADDEQAFVQSAIDKFNEFKDLFDDGQFSAAMSAWGDDIDQKLTEVAGDIDDWYNNDVAPWFTKEKWSALGENMKKGISDKWTDFKNWWQTTGVYRWYEDKVKPWFSKDKWNFDGIRNGMEEAWGGAIQSIKNTWNQFANYLNQHLKFTMEPIVISGKTIFSGGTLDLGKIPTFATGGFPEDGWFRASKGEYFGRFDDGTSYIANNRQIENGIALGVDGAVRNANEEQNALLREQNELLREILQKDTGISYKDVFNAAKKGAYEYYRSTGENALAF